VAAELGGGRHTGSEPAIGVTIRLWGGVERLGIGKTPSWRQRFDRITRAMTPRAIGTSSHFQDESGNEAV
jgi:hypothetical protein